MPLFLMFTVAIIHFMILLSVQNDIQLRMDETARDIGKRAYIADDSEILSLASSNFLVIQAEILNDALKERLDNSGVVGGSGGLSMILSTYDKESGILDIVVTYRYKFPYLPSGFSTLSLMQRSYTRAWIGEELDTADSGEEEEEEEEQTVYITPTGTVYHLTASCPYLDLSIHAISYSELSSARNKGGARYYRCQCAASSNPQTVYITDYGTKWHTDLTCSSLKRTVMEVKISQVSGRNACSKCGK